MHDITRWTRLTVGTRWRFGAVCVGCVFITALNIWGSILLIKWTTLTHLYPSVKSFQFSLWGLFALQCVLIFMGNAFIPIQAFFALRCATQRKPAHTTDVVPPKKSIPEDGQNKEND